MAAIKKKSEKEKVALDFMVVPSFLRSHCYVKNRIKILVVKPRKIFLTGLFGDSGRKMVRAGIPFYFKRSLAVDFIKRGIAIRIR